MTEPWHAVFLSYASQDAQAAQRIYEALRAAGIEVWFDRSELRGRFAVVRTERIRSEPLPKMSAARPSSSFFQLTI